MNDQPAAEGIASHNPLTEGAIARRSRRETTENLRQPSRVLHDRNVAALYAQALGLCGVSVATGDLDRAGNAGDAFTRARAVTTAAGVTTASLQLLDQIRSNDQAGLLTELRAAQSL